MEPAGKNLQFSLLQLVLSTLAAGVLLGFFIWAPAPTAFVIPLALALALALGIYKFPIMRSERAVIVALIAPSLFLLYWLFRYAGVSGYFEVVHGYSSNLPAAGRVPAALLCLCILFVVLARSRVAAIRGGEAPLDRPLRRGLFLSLPFAGALLLSLPLIGAGLLQNVLSAALGGGILLAVLGLGLALLCLPPFSLAAARFNSALERAVLAAALGLGALALALFVLGSLGVLQAWVWWIVMLLCCTAGFRPLCALASELHAGMRGYASRHHPVATVAVAFTAAWVAVHIPLVWAAPLDYDVLEYHLAAPAQYLREGKISFLQQNIYATFPENGEMLYLLGQILGAEKWRGLAAAHAVLLGVWALSICGVYVLIQRLAGAGGSGQSAGGSGQWAVGSGQAAVETQNSEPDTRNSEPGSPSVAPALGALMFALVPLGSQMAGDFYVEHFQSLFHLSAVMAGCAFLGDRRSGTSQRYAWLALCGVLAGFACGTKYTALLFTLFPLALLLPLLCLRGGSILEAARVLACIVLGAGGALAPWLLRNLIASGDPIHPLGLVLKRRLLGGPELPDRIDHFEAAHRAGDKSIKAFFAALGGLWPSLSPPAEGADGAPGLSSKWMAQLRSGPHLLAFAAVGFLNIVRSEVLLIAGVLVLDLGLWFMFSHRLDRFLFPMLSLLAVLGGVGIARLWRMNLALRIPTCLIPLAAVLVLAPISVLFVVYPLSGADRVAGIASPEDFLRAQFHSGNSSETIEAWRYVDSKLPPGSKALFLGEAQTFYITGPVEYSVVFNDSLLEQALRQPDAADARKFLAAHGVTHIYINYSEWFRLDTSYAVERDANPVSPGNARVPWRRAELTDYQRGYMRYALSQRKFRAYGELWKRGQFPAYLKLDPAGYAILEDLILRQSEQERGWNTDYHLLGEVRKLVE